MSYVIVKFMVELFRSKVEDIIGSQVLDILSSINFDEISTAELYFKAIEKFKGPIFYKDPDFLWSIYTSAERLRKSQLLKYLGLNDLPELEKLKKVKSFVSHNCEEAYLYFSREGWIPAIQINKKEQHDQEEIGFITISPVYGKTITSQGRPHYYQKELKSLLHNNIHDRVLLSMPTGAGKTRTAQSYMCDILRAQKTKILWLVDAPSLAFQSFISFQKLWKEKGDSELKIVNLYGGHFKEKFDVLKSVDVIFTTFQNLLNLQENNSLSTLEVDMVVVDEVHSSLAERYSEVLFGLESSKLIGLTATPSSDSDNQFVSLKSFFNENIISLMDVFSLGLTESIKKLQSEKFLAKIRFETFYVEDVSESSNELNQKSIGIIKSLYQEGKNIIVFANSKYHAVALSVALEIKGCRSYAITGEIIDEREDIFKKFKVDNSPLILTNHTILQTGIDLPNVDALVILRSLNNDVSALQMLGRALRGVNNGGNEENSIVSLEQYEGVVQAISNINGQMFFE